MSAADLVNPIFNDPIAARSHLELLRWSGGRFCPHCGESGRTSSVKSKAHEGLYYCNSCEKTFTVLVGTVFERSHIPVNKWLLAFHLMNSSKKGISAHQLHRMLGITYKSAWFMAHRIREAMRDDGSSGPLGGTGKIIEADEAYVGPSPSEFRDGKWHRKQGIGGKIAVVSLVERGGRARTLKVDSMKRKDVEPFVRANVNKGSRFMTDEAPMYRVIAEDFASHETVNHHKKEYARGDVTTNTVEGFFSIFKRGMRGVYQHCGEQHLQRYLNEFDFRYSHRIACGYSDAERAEIAIKGAEGKRLTYRQPRGSEAA